jgi:uncharacterized protein YbjT (DUF2867 family)
MRIAVAGGTGLVGEKVVRELSSAGHHPVVLARSQGVDLSSGKGLGEKLAGCTTIIDVSNSATTRKSAATSFFSSSTRHLLEAGERAGVQHIVTLSIVGIDKVDFGYYMGKREQERLVSQGPLPWTILRATQFHEFPEPLLALRAPLVVVPHMLSQPVAAAEVASALAGLAEAPAGGYLQPLAGPEQLQMTSMARRLMRARADRRPLLPVKLPGKVGRAMTTGGLLPRGPSTQGKVTFEDYLRQVAAVSR